MARMLKHQSTETKDMVNTTKELGVMGTIFFSFFSF